MPEIVKLKFQYEFNKHIEDFRKKYTVFCGIA